MQGSSDSSSLNGLNAHDLNAILVRKQRPRLKIIFGTLIILSIVGASIAILATSFFPNLFTKKGSVGRIEAISGGANALSGSASSLHNHGGADSSSLNANSSNKSQGQGGVGLVHVLGQVKNPGVYPIKPKSRVVDVIQSAGGFLPDSDQSSVNLAEFVSDADQIIVAKINQDGSGVASGSASKTKLININKASESDLTQLPRVGPATAKKIVQYRQKHGKFKSIDSLGNIPGIGPALIAGIRDLAKV